MSRLHRQAVKVLLFTAFATFIFSPRPANAETIAADPAKPSEYCSTCGCSSSGGSSFGGSSFDSCSTNLSTPVAPQMVTTASFVSFTEGNVAEDYSVAQVRSAFGVTLDFHLIYNSYNADGSRDMYLGAGSPLTR